MKKAKNIVMLLCIPISFFGTLFALSFMWGTYIVPLGLPMLSYAHLFGINTFISFLTMTFSKSDLRVKLEDEEEISRNIVIAIAPWLYLLSAWIISLFM